MYDQALTNDYQTLTEDDFYSKYYATAEYVINNILSTSGTKQDVEECAQDVLLEVMSHMDKYDPRRGGLKNYIRVIARSKALYVVKKLQKDSCVPFDDTFMLSYTDEEYLKDIVANIMKSLNKEERKLFTMRFLYCMPIEDISKQLGIRRGSTDTKLSRLRKKLAGLFQEQGIETTKGENPNE